MYSRILFFIALFVFLFSCTNEKSKPSVLKLDGVIQGTTYHITYLDSANRNFDVAIDSLFREVDNSMSVYVENSLISIFNKADSIGKIDEGFLHVILKAKEVYETTGGSFDPTINPLAEYLGFGTKGLVNKEVVDTAKIDSILQFVGLDKVKIVDENWKEIKLEDLRKENLVERNCYLYKTDARVTINFNAIAQGYSVDVIAEFFEEKGIYDYLVEVGGELRVNGKNAKGDWWKIGIDKPIESEEFSRELQAVVVLQNKSLATSGNYRKFHEKNGVKYSHTISPKTGFPVRRKILSATVIANDCMTADAYATAFMVMGVDQAIQILNEKEDLKGYFIYSDKEGTLKTYQSEGLELEEAKQ